MPATDVTRVEVEEAGQIIPLLEKGLGLTLALQAASDDTERARLTAELEKACPGIAEPKSELGKKLREIQKYSQAEFAESDVVIMAALMPVMKSFREQIVESITKKENRKHELERERSSPNAKGELRQLRRDHVPIIWLDADPHQGPAQREAVVDVVA